MPVIFALNVSAENALCLTVAEHSSPRDVRSQPLLDPRMYWRYAPSPQNGMPELAAFRTANNRLYWNVAQWHAMSLLILLHETPWLVRASMGIAVTS